MSDTPPKKAWKAFGTCKSDSQKTDDEILIWEFPYSTQLQEGDPAYGRPVDATLAVDMITQFWKRIKKEMPHTWANFALNFDTSFENFLSDDVSDIDKDAIIQEANLARIWLFQFLSSSFAMTFDKSILLKILSQPQCEGVRFYMCSKSNPKAKTDSRELDQIMSLVLVGVNDKSQDLLYMPPQDSWVDDKDKSIDTVSLVGEYGHPPGLFGKVMQQKEIGDAFALFKYTKLDLQKP